ncbi:hypothetical protein Scep_018878 [Stephania cephalantha]|uniref:Uncharacterized protein n=1 Tax=Stephania cephalantha TaxID=152367 RepID=A0AAP0I9U8_9MAGN
MAAFSPNLCRFNSTPISPFPHTPKTSHRVRTNTVRATASSEKKTSKPSEEEDSTKTASTQSKPLKKPIYSMGHPPYYKGLDYIYEDRGEIAWVGIPTAPAWLPTDMLIKKLNWRSTNALGQLGLQNPYSLVVIS